MKKPPAKPNPPQNLFRRGPWENAATALIGVGIFMLMQPFLLGLFTYSFITILTGTLMFVVVSHFRD
ncbi:MAG TPA: hypothetical protein VMT98_00565 [Verrucomicrobiae bacterium]|jgi:hypothetical protein|nr:hypothetical protein [Verrucomicrobiae bacterium]